jgi:DNA gyrase subunit A
MLISTGGTVIRMPIDGIRQMSRLTQGVTVMRLREGERVSALAPVVEASEEDEPAAALEVAPAPEQ